MSIALCFAIVMLLLIVFEFRPNARAQGILLLIALILLGWGLFGPLIHR